MALVNINIHLHADMGDMEEKLDVIIKQNHKLMATIAQLSEKVDLLQTTIDETQATALEKITTLETTVQELKDVIAAGGEQGALQEVADKLDAATADLKSTFPSPL